MVAEERNHMSNMSRDILMGPRERDPFIQLALSGEFGITLGI